MIFTRISAAALAICAHLVNEYSKSEKAFAVSLALVSLSVLAIIASELGEYIAKAIRVTRREQPRSTPDSIKARLLAKGFALADSPIGQYRKTVTGPNGEIFGPMTANECAARFLDGEDLAPHQVHSTPARSERAAKPADRLTDVGAAARDAEHARRPQFSPEK